MRSHPHEFLSQKEYASKTSVPLQSVRKSNPVRMTYHGLPSSTPFAAQENNRGTSYHPHPVRMDRSVSLVQLQLGGHVHPGHAAKECTGLRYFAHFADRPKIVQMHRFDPTWQQHQPDLGSTSASKAPTSAQLGPTWLQGGSSLGPS